MLGADNRDAGREYNGACEKHRQGIQGEYQFYFGGVKMACLFGHKWDGCKCDKCGKTRDEQHDWDLCKGKCKRCGKPCKEQHEWSGCKCTRCGKVRDEQHDWIGCKCEKCGKSLTIKDLENIAEHQPTWFSETGFCNNEYGITSFYLDAGYCDSSEEKTFIAECGKNIEINENGYILGKSWSFCKCPSCGYAVHLDLQSDYTCKACGEKASIIDVITTISALGERVKYERSYLEKVTLLSSRLPVVLAASIESSNMLDVIVATHNFNNFESTRDEYIQLTEKGRKPTASEIESLFTSIMQKQIQLWANEKPEKNIFA
jgi:hypothetical protein